MRSVELSGAEFGSRLCAAFSCQIPLRTPRRTRPHGNRDTQQDVDPQVLSGSMERAKSARSEQISFAEPCAGGSTRKRFDDRPEAYQAVVARFLRAFSGLKFEVQDMVCEKDKVVASWTITGVHTGEYNGIAATNKKIAVEGISIHQISNGKIMDTSSVWDTLGLLKKIGGVVTVGKTAGKARGN